MGVHSCHTVEVDWTLLCISACTCRVPLALLEKSAAIHPCPQPRMLRQLDRASGTGCGPAAQPGTKALVTHAYLRCRTGATWQARLLLDVVLPLKGQPSQQTLESLLGSPWPKACPGVSSSLHVQVAQPPAGPMPPHMQQPAGTAGKLLLLYDLSEPLSSHAQQRQPAWDLGRPAPASQAVRVQQYIGGRQGLQGVLNIHVTRPHASNGSSEGLPEAGTRGRQLYCLLQELPWAMQLGLDRLRLEVQLGVWPPWCICVGGCTMCA